MSESPDELNDYMNIYNLTWPSKGPKDGQLIQGFGGPHQGGPIYATTR